MRKVHNFDDSNKTAQIGNILLEALSDSYILKGRVESTESGGYEDRRKKIDAFILKTGDSGKEYKHSLQIKTDLQHPTSLSLALELCEISWGSGLMYNGRDGNLLQKELLEVDYIVYILPGTGIYFWKPRELNRLTYFLIRHYQQVDTWEEVQHTFRFVTANNGDWFSICYLVPYYMINEPNYYRTKCIEWPNKYESTENPLGPVHSIQWYDAVSLLQKNKPESYEEIIPLVINYADSFSKPKRDKILRSWELNPEQT